MTKRWVIEKIKANLLVIPRPIYMVGSIMSSRTLHPGMAHNGIWIKSGEYAPSCPVDNYPDNKLNVVANHENSINMTMMARGNMEGGILSSKGTS